MKIRKNLVEATKKAEIIGGIMKIKERYSFDLDDNGDIVACNSGNYVLIKTNKNRFFFIVWSSTDVGYQEVYSQKYLGVIDFYNRENTETICPEEFINKIYLFIEKENTNE